MNKWLCNIEFTQKEYDEIENKFFNQHLKFLVKYKTIYQIHYSNMAGLYGIQIYKKPKNEKLGFTKRGRFIITNANQVNDLMEREFVVD